MSLHCLVGKILLKNSIYIYIYIYAKYIKILKYQISNIFVYKLKTLFSFSTLPNTLYVIAIFACAKIQLHRRLTLTPRPALAGIPIIYYKTGIISIVGVNLRIKL